VLVVTVVRAWTVYTLATAAMAGSVD